MLHLIHREIGMLQRQAAEADESVRMRGAQRGDLFILARNDFFGEIAACPIVVRGREAHRLDIDSVFVHVAKPGFEIFCGAEKRAVEGGRAAVGNIGFGMPFDKIVQIDIAVRVDVYRADAAAGQHNLAAFRDPGRLLAGRKC